MIGRITRWAALTGVAGALLLLGGHPAAASPWKTVQTETGVQYRIGNEIRNSFVIHCGSTAKGMDTWIDMTVHGEPLPALRTIHVVIGQQEFFMDVDGNGRVLPATQPADLTFDRLWAAMRAGPSMIVNYPDGLSGTFTLRGTDRTMPDRACATRYDRS